MSQNQESPFGVSTQKYWDVRHKLFSKFDDGILIDKEGLFSVVPEEEGLDIARRTPGHCVLDAFGGVAGNSICFARAGKDVISVEINPERHAMCMHNAKIYGVVDKIAFKNADIDTVIDMEGIDTIFFDPPWGGPDYSQREKLFMRDFNLGSVSMQNLVQHSSAKHVVMRLPRNFAFETLGVPESQIVHYKKPDGQAYFSCLFASREQFLAIV